MLVWNSKSLREALKVEVPDNIEAGIVQFNSKDVREGDLFIALQGDNGNGHDYALDAYKKGAGALILDRTIENIPEDKVILVKDTGRALTDLAIHKRNNTKARIIAITGSAGKTSTRDWLRATLDNFSKCYSSRGSFNNILGVRLELASMPIELDYGIFEVGMNHSGEIRELIGYIRPDIAMINNVLPSHIGFFNNIEEIAAAKSEIFESMAENGIAILNKGDGFFDYCRSKAQENGIKQIYSFGENFIDADSNLVQYNMSQNHIINIDGKDISFKTKIGGRHRILNLTAVLLICKILGLDLEKSAKSFENLVESNERGRIYKIQYGNFKCEVIDDAYNATPPAVAASLTYMGELNHPYKVAVLGDMRELGKDEIKYHEDLLPYVLESKVSKVHTVGHLMRHLYDKLPSDIKGNHYNDYLNLQNNLKDVIDRDMMILFKASNGTKVRLVVNELLNKA